MRSVAAEALGRLGNRRAVEPLLAALTDEDATVRRRAIGALGTIGDTRGLKPLIAALNDGEPTIRRRAAVELRHFGDERAVMPLVATLADTDTKVRRYAAESLGHLGDERAMAALVHILGREGEYRSVRRTVAKALTRFGPAAVDPLISTLSHPDYIHRVWTAQALGKLGGCAGD